jgi:uncharacterized membrane protein
MSIATVIVCVLVPALALWLVARHSWARRAGTIVLCYAAGLLAGNAGMLPEATLAARGRLAELAVVLALPMILFSIDVRAWSRAAPRALAAMGLAVLAVVSVATVVFFTLRTAELPRPHEFAGLAVGVYTGGTPNLAAIKIALGVDDSRYLLFNAVDTVASVAYLMFMVTLGKRVFGRWLAPASCDPAMLVRSGEPAPIAGQEDFRYLLSAAGLREATLSVLLAAAIVALALGAAEVLAGGSAALVIAIVATLGIAASFNQRVRDLAGAYPAGMYLIYVFSFTVASMARIELLFDTGLMVPAFISAAVFGSVAVHALLCRLARIDVDTFLVTSVAAICSPAFVPLMARSLGNPAMLLSGIATGIIGYAIGTYLGIGLALLLARFT